MSSMAVTSDRNASRGSVKQDESNITIKASDIGYPATTSSKKVVKNYLELMDRPKKELLVVFGTYQSIDVPEKAYEYVVNGRSAIEWIIDQYQVKTDKKSGITDDPNDYSDDEKYIFNLLLRIINVSVQTVDLINSLPKFEVEE